VVTVEEMTRRRDHWRNETRRLQRELIDARQLIEKQRYELAIAEHTKRSHHLATTEARRQLAGAEAQANQFALELAELRARLAV